MRKVHVSELPPDIQKLVKKVCRRCGTSEPGGGGSFVYADETWSHVLCSPGIMADVCDCGDWEADHALRRGACRECDCSRYRFSGEEPMPADMHYGQEPRKPAAEIRLRYADARRIDEATKAVLAGGAA